MSDLVGLAAREMQREQPAPTPNGRPAVWDLVVEDMRARDALGRSRYGTPLQAGNGRDALRDLYEELLDAAVYAKAEMEERDTPAALARSLLRLADNDAAMFGAGHTSREAVFREAARELERIAGIGQQPNGAWRKCDGPAEYQQAQRRALEET